MKALVEPGCHDPDNNAAKDAHIVAFDIGRSCQLRYHGLKDGDKNQVANKAGYRCGSVRGEAVSDTNRENHGQVDGRVIQNNTTSLSEKWDAIRYQISVMGPSPDIGLSQAQQQRGDGQHRDRQHQGSSQSLRTTQQTVTQACTCGSGCSVCNTHCKCSSPEK